MIQSITQDNQNDKVLSEKIQSFFKRFHVTSALKAANAYMKKGLKMGCINWIRFTTILSSRIVNQSIYDLTSDQRVNSFVMYFFRQNTLKNG